MIDIIQNLSIVGLAVAVFIQTKTIRRNTDLIDVNQRLIGNNLSYIGKLITSVEKNMKAIYNR